ncbi:MAG TPA: hypothetical protein VFX98_06450 [Longimicrobiaceae bacterium]|nr:hypothetical protein [Longimicrobiaceae bacterium]
MDLDQGTPPGVLIRDFLIFKLKLIMDGLKDLALIQVSIVVFFVDLIFGGRRRGRLFYGLIHLSERFDLWLNLHGASRHAARNPDGLFGESRAGDDTLLGELEEMVRRAEAAERVPAAGRAPIRR